MFCLKSILIKHCSSHIMARMALSTEAHIEAAISKVCEIEEELSPVVSDDEDSEDDHHESDCFSVSEEEYFPSDEHESSESDVGIQTEKSKKGQKVCITTKPECVIGST